MKKTMREEYITVDVVAENWEIFKRRVQVLSSYGRVEGTKKNGYAWAIPVNSNKPETIRPGEKGE